MRTKNKKIFLTTLSALAIWAVIGWFFLYYKDFKAGTRQLVEYVPKEALAFIEFDLDKQNFNVYLEEQPPAKKLLEKFMLTNELPASIWRGHIAIDKLALVLFQNDQHQGKFDKAWLVHGRGEIRQLEATALADYYYATRSKQIAVISKSKHAMDLMARHNVIDSLDIAYSDEDADEFIYGYIKVGLLSDKFKGILNNDLIESNPWLGINKEETINWQIGISDEGNILLSFNLGNGKIKKTRGMETEPTNKFLKLDRTIMARDLDLLEVLAVLNKQLNKEKEINLQSLKKFLNDKYKIKVDEMYTFFEQPVLLVLRPRTGAVNLENLFNFNNYYYGIVWQDSFNLPDSRALTNLERFTQNYLAFKYPEKKIKVLPDGTSGFELVARADRFIWQSGQSESGAIRFIKTQETQVAYGWNKHKFVLSNSINLAEALLGARQAEGKDGGYSLKIDTQILNNDYLELGRWLWLKCLNQGETLQVKASLNKIEAD